MNLKLDENNKAIFICNGREHVIINAEIIGNYIDVKFEDDTPLTIYNNEENIKILKY
ncbi:hypothetical protein [Aliarcobacter butzleri]|nr:hypothetical protein [Aliarcobacter butzleri]MCT7615738.1 hypothetical protein [Aliarcobacter butzleri]